MKVLQINSVCGIGSTGRIATDIHNILLERGHESYIAYGRDLPKNCYTAIKIGTKLDNYKHVAKTRLFDRHGFGSRRATESFIEKVKQLNPDVIHLHNIHGYYINIDLLFNYLKEANKPVVWTLHDCWSFTGHCAYFDYAGCDKWETLCFECPEMRTYPSSLILDNSSINYEHKKDLFTGVANLSLVTPSKWLASLVKKSFLKEYPIEVINNGIDLSVFEPYISDFRSKHGIDDKFMILGVANFWGRRKGLNYFLELAEIINEDEVIVLVGLSKKQLIKLPKGIIGITRTNNINDLVGIYSSADIFVNPTLEEVFGMTNIEALACGTPVITFDTGGSPECIDERTGVVVNKSDIKELIMQLRLLKKKKYSKNALLQRAKLFDKDHMFDEYIQLYRDINYKSVEQ